MSLFHSLICYAREFKSPVGYLPVGMIFFFLSTVMLWHKSSFFFLSGKLVTSLSICMYPTNTGIVRGTVSVATIVVVSAGVDI